MLWIYFKKGGILMLPILACSVIALMIIIERLVFIMKVKKESARLFDEVSQCITQNKIDGALEICNNLKGSIPASIIKAGILNRNKKHEIIREAIDDAGMRALPQIERLLPFLGTIVAIAPMLGLLGTVVGMIESSNVLAALGTANPGELILGIAKALITTAFGMIVAIPSLIMHNYLIHKAQDTIVIISKKSDEFVQQLTYEKEENVLREPNTVYNS